MSHDRLSDECLNAFVDNQLDAEEKSRIYRMMNSDEALNRETCELRKLKDLVRHAYSQPPASRNDSTPIKRIKTACAGIAAALALLVVGGAGGWMAHTQLTPPSQNLALLNGQQTIAPQSDVKRVMLHISTNDHQRVMAALDDAEELLSTYQGKAGITKVQLEIVVNAEGINLLLANQSQYENRIHQLVSHYDNVSFLACARTLEKLRLKGRETSLVPDAAVIPGALERIVTRLQEGWVYIKV